jgi:hypothetical protein
MRTSKWTEAQIIGMLREHEQGRKVAEIWAEDLAASSLNSSTNNTSFSMEHT